MSQISENTNQTQDIDALPEFLYKFRDWNDPNHRRLLSDRELWFCSPDALNDPFDCRILLRYDLEPRANRRKSAMRAITHLNPTASRHRRRSWALKQEKATFSNKQEVEKAMARQEARMFDTTGICSFAGDSQQLLLWSHYARSHEGFCAVFSTIQLLRAIVGMNIRDKREAYLFGVNYQKLYPRIRPISDGVEKSIRLALTTKSDEWSYEREFRFIMFHDTNRAVQFPQNVLARVLLGCRIKKEHRSEISEIVSRNFPNAEVLQAVRKRDKFALDFVPVQVSHEL